MVSFQDPSGLVDDLLFDRSHDQFGINRVRFACPCDFNERRDALQKALESGEPPEAAGGKQDVINI